MIRIALTILIFATAAASEDYQYQKNWTTNRTKIWASHLSSLKGKPNLKMVEVGSYEGRSAIWFLDHILTDPTSTITCIDPFSKDTEARWDHNIKVSGHAARVIKIKDYSQHALRVLKPRSIDIIYIDGCHLTSCVYIDTALSWDLLKVGGYLIWDDYGERTRPKKAIDLFVTSFREDLTVLFKGIQVVVRKERYDY